jgi:uncharacterized protein (DUF1501 family)
MRRREFLRAGLGGFVCLSLPELLALRARAGQPGARTALIVVWLQGGASHLETYDPKPDAPAEVRGLFGAIATRAAGVRISELLPRHADVADKFAILRSLAHTGFCHQQGNQQSFPRAGHYAADRAGGAAGVRPEPGGSRLRDSYGRNTWGQRCLLARRLVEAGVDLVTTSLDGPLCGRVGNWDDHAVNHHVFDAMKARCRYFDQAVSALIEDVHTRGLDRRVLIVVTGEFGRTPKISYARDSASGVTQPGRDHWPRAVSLLFSGGGIPGGQVVGATDRLGADVTRRRVGVRDFLPTIYHHLGIDAGSITLRDRAGRPVPVLPDGRPIAELTAPDSQIRRRRSILEGRPDEVREPG